jgi:predicted TIM-barrel fold metal-dependent hydrolase
MNKPMKDPLAGLKIVDVDTHLTEPPDLWTSRAPAALRDRMPQVGMLDGDRRWLVDGKHPMGGRGASSVVRKDGEKARGMEFTAWQAEDVALSCSNTQARLKYMDDEGIWAQIVYPNVLGFGGQKSMNIDPELRSLCVTIYNDYLAQMQEESNQRLLGMALLPWWDIKATVKEIERCAAMGLKGVNTNSDPHRNGLPDLGDAHWDPLWEICSDLNLPINFHIGASDDTMSWFGDSPWPSLPAGGKLALGSAMMYISNAKVLANIIYSGLLDRYPKLKFVSVESGIGWIPFMLQGLDYQLGETAPDVGEKLQMRPLDYFRRNFFACFWFEREDLPDLVKRVGVDNVMFETDFPHPTCLYPDSLGYVRGALEGADPALVGKIMGGNAARVYNLTLPA